MPKEAPWRHLLEWFTQWTYAWFPPNQSHRPELQNIAIKSLNNIKSIITENIMYQFCNSGHPGQLPQSHHCLLIWDLGWPLPCVPSHNSCCYCHQRSGDQEWIHQESEVEEEYGNAYLHTWHPRSAMCTKEDYAGQLININSDFIPSYL